jgi:hypothetical protein
MQPSSPNCTVTVYLTGSAVKAKIYSDNNNTPLQNPFTVGVAPETSSNGYWFFYAANGRYDVQFSGGGSSTPFSLGDRTTFDEQTLWANVAIAGATGDGITDDTVAIQAALNTGLCAYFPPGRYVYSSPLTIPNGGCLKAEHRENVLLFYTGDVYPSIRPATFAPDQHLSIYNISLYKSGVQTGTALTLNGAQKGTVFRCYFFNWSIGIDLDGRDNGTYFNTIDQNVFDTISSEGIWCHGNSAQQCNRNTVINNRMQTVNNGIVCQAQYCEVNYFAANDVEGLTSDGSTAYDIEGDGNTLTGNWMEGNPTAGQTFKGVKLAGFGNTLSGNHYAFGSSGGAFINLDYGAQYPAVHNIFEPWMITAASSSSAMFTHIPIWDQTIRGITSHDIVAGAGQAGLAVSRVFNSGGDPKTGAGLVIATRTDFLRNDANADSLYQITQDISKAQLSAGANAHVDVANTAANRHMLFGNLTDNGYGGFLQGFNGVRNTFNYPLSLQPLAGAVVIGTGADDGVHTLQSYGPSSTGPNNFIVDGGADNAISGSLEGQNMSAGLCVNVKLRHSMQAGSNTFDFNRGGAVPIRSHLDTAHDIAAGYVANGFIVLCYDGVEWVDISQ